MFKKILIANRGEIALRIARTAADMGIACVQAVAADDARGHGPSATCEWALLPATGPAAYLDIDGLVNMAQVMGCEAIHPGYGFLSERADFAATCSAAGLVFIGPTAPQLACFGDKARARALAVEQGVPVLAGSASGVDLVQARAFFAAQGEAGVMVKAVAGGGGRGMRVVRHADELAAALARCQAEAKAAFGADAVYLERLMPRARHIEVQIVGDGRDVISLGDRECSLQRRFQKLVEIAPSPCLDDGLRQRLIDAALKMARATTYSNLGTFEFLVDTASADHPFVFIEANPRLQVEHTVTEQVTGLDLVRLQIELASGSSLGQLGLAAAHPVATRGFAIQWRINAERLDADGTARPTSGSLTRLDGPSGPGIRIDTAARVGTAPSMQYDTLLVKLVVTGGSYAQALRRSQRALGECAIEGLETNLALLQAVAARPEVERADWDTGFVERHLPALLEAAGQGAGETGQATPPGDGLEVRAPLAGKLVQQEVAIGETVIEGALLAVVESMKMEHLVLAPRAGKVLAWHAEPGDGLVEGQALLLLQPIDEAEAAAAKGQVDAAGPAVRVDLEQLRERLAFTQDAARPEAVAARHARAMRTARENIDALCDAGTFSEYGALAVAAQRSRRSAEDLIRNTPADGMVTGIGSINGKHFSAERSRAVVMAYDATVLAGTQGMRNHQKTDRLLGVALKHKLPVVLFAEGGGGRPGDTDAAIVAGLHVGTFASFAKLSGQVPVIGIAAGRCFAGNAALLGCCDVIIATRGSNIGMGGPAMVEGGGLGVFKPEQIGPASVQAANGVIDLLVDDEVHAVAVARQYLSYFQGALSEWACADQSGLRQAVPENRLRIYDMRQVLQGLVDTGSLLELRAGFGLGMITALARIEGRPLGLLANNPAHLGGAIDAAGADKAARFMQLCNAHGLPMLSLVDTPGFMVGPEIEKQAQVRHVCRMFIVSAALRVPFFSVVLRKGYGLGAMGMTAGGFHAPDFTVAWPSGEFGAMGLEGAVRLGWRKELEALPAGPEREAKFKALLAQQIDAGSAINLASTLEIDAVIDPADTRDWVVRGLASARVTEVSARFIDPW